MMNLVAVLRSEDNDGDVVVIGEGWKMTRSKLDEIRARAEVETFFSCGCKDESSEGGQERFPRVEDGKEDEEEPDNV